MRAALTLFLSSPSLSPRRRFYFLSNDELISILSQTKDPNAVQPHLRKCFEAVHAITMKGAECEMSDMVSPEKERVPFLETIYPTGSVEVWMGVIEDMMRKSVRHTVRVGLDDYKEQPRGEFVLHHSSQAAIAVTQFYWTAGIEQGLNERFSGGMLGQGTYFAEVVEKIDQSALLPPQS